MKIMPDDEDGYWRMVAAHPAHPADAAAVVKAATCNNQTPYADAKVAVCAARS